MRKLSLPEGKHLSPLLLVKFWRMELQLVSYRLGIYIFIYIPIIRIKQIFVHIVLK